MTRWVIAALVLLAIDLLLLMVWGGAGAATEDCHNETAPQWLCGPIPRYAGAALIPGVLFLAACAIGLAATAWHRIRRMSR